MKFRTEYAAARGGFALEAGDEAFAAGSCFAEHIVARLRDAWIRVEANPTGILFNPLSIARMLGDLYAGRRWGPEDLECDGGMWFDFDHHGSFSGPDRDEVLKTMNASAERASAALERVSAAVITFGTAWVYRLAAGGRPVANCHRQPAARFVRSLAGVDEICAAWDGVLRGPLAGKRVVLTVSPVRHLADGFAGNSLSKAVLRLAAQRLADGCEAVEYFPAFEIVTDDLRDYRFYGEDMAHPTAQAAGYVWEKFAQTYLGARTLAQLPRLEKLSAALRHRPLHPGAEEGKVFRDSTLALARELAARFPEADFSAVQERFGDG